MAKNNNLIPCQVCGTPAFEELENEDICQVCGWQNDGTAEWGPDIAGANPICFNDAKKMWDEGKAFKDGYPNPKAKE